MLFPSLLFFTGGAYFQVIMHCTLLSALYCCLILPCITYSIYYLWFILLNNTLPKVVMKYADVLFNIKTGSFPSSGKEPTAKPSCSIWWAAFSGRKALEGIIVGLILNRSVSVDIPGAFSCVKAGRKTCPSLSCFFDFCLPNSLASIFLFYSEKLSQQNLQPSYILCNLYGQTWSVPTKILTGSSAELCCNLKQSHSRMWCFWGNV